MWYGEGVGTSGAEALAALQGGRQTFPGVRAELGPSLKMDQKATNLQGQLQTAFFFFKKI